MVTQAALTLQAHFLVTLIFEEEIKQKVTSIGANWQVVPNF